MRVRAIELGGCVDEPCSNGATCIRGPLSTAPDSFSCICPVGFTGNTCQTDIDECSSSPCAHPATCRQLQPGYFDCLWATIVGDRGGLIDQFTAVDKVDAIGSIVVAGQAASPFNGMTILGSSDAVLARYSSTGALLWSQNYGSVNSERLSSVVFHSQTDTVLACGATSGMWSGALGGRVSTGTGEDWVIMSANAANGQRLWAMLGGTVSEDSCTSLAVDMAGNVFMTGISASDVMLARFGYSAAAYADSNWSAVWTLAWMRTHGTTRSDAARSVVLAADGFGYIAGAWNLTVGMIAQFSPASGNLTQAR